MEWNESFRTGIEILDKEHKRLFRVIDKLIEHKEEERDPEWSCKEGIKFFTNHAQRHFAEEEAYMETIGFPGLEHHRQLHDAFRDTTLPVLVRELKQSNYSQSAVDHFLGVAGGWLLTHTLSEDLAIVGQGSSKWNNLLATNDLNALKEVIVEYVFDIYNLESHLVSGAYGGERFGNGVYYRLVYRNDAKQTHEIVLVLEEKFMVGTIGKLLGLETSKLDRRLLHSSRYAARQFVDNIHNHFGMMDGYKLIDEEFLTYNQFRDLFEKQQPQASLLFDSGAGYFAYCMVVSETDGEPEVVSGTVIEEENATAEIEEYLESREQKRNRRKVLLVDDSAMVRETIRELLREDYEISVAESGIAAIRAITLSKPDLVLLDYQMPVVDGHQTLQMLRQESDLADVPVIFLTGSDDPDSVRKLVALKPQGYLLKTMKPVILKEKIDALAQRLCASAS